MIDVAIALALIYLMLAGLVSGINELVATALQQRGKVLVKGIESLLCGAAAALQNGQPLKDEIMKHPMIDVLRNGERLPSYIPSASFATAFADILVRSYQTAKPLFEGLPEAVAKLPEGDLKRGLNLLVIQSGDSAEKLRTLLEAHFDTIMERASGWYKRQSQIAIMVIAVVVCAVLNVDSIALLRQLARDPALTGKLVAQAQTTIASPAPAPAPEAGSNKDGAGVPPQKATQPAAASVSADASVDKKFEMVQADVSQFRNLGAPIGWTVVDGVPRLTDDQMRLGLWFVVAGWLISALAASLGAPFWFDAISKLVSLRGAGTAPPDKSGGASSTSSPPSGTTVVVQPAKAPDSAVASTEPIGPVNDFESARLSEVDIEHLQRALGMAAKDASTVLDGPTRIALRNWQQAHGRPVTGVFDEATVLAILYPEA